MPDSCYCPFCLNYRTHTYYFWTFVLIVLAVDGPNPFYVDPLRYPPKCRLFDGKFNFGRKP